MRVLGRVAVFVHVCMFVYVCKSVCLIEYTHISFVRVFIEGRICALMCVCSIPYFFECFLHRIRKFAFALKVHKEKAGLPSSPRTVGLQILI